ncbi:MAG: GNAT family N-acetyltransferase [Saprospiraceae bacterium]
MLETNKLRIKPLTYPQLLKYARNDNSLEEEFKIKASSRVISPELKDALEHTILPNVSDPTKNYLYNTLWTIISKSENQMVGDICIVGEPNTEGEIEIGYGTYEDYRGKGYMSEAVGAMIEWAKSEPDVLLIVAATDKNNIASYRILEKHNFRKSDETESLFHWRLNLKSKQTRIHLEPIMEPRIETLKTKKLIGKRLTMTMEENKTIELWRNFMPRRKEITNALSSDLISMQVYDNSFDFLHFNIHHAFEKWAAVEVSDFDIIPEGMETYTLPSGLYAVFIHQGPASEGERTFRYIFETWIPQSPFIIDARPHFEILGEKYKHDDPSSEEEVWIPVRLKNSIHSI